MQNLTPAQLQEIGSIEITTLISEERLTELYELIGQGYWFVPLVCAIREAAYAARNNIVIPPNMPLS